MSIIFITFEERNHIGNYMNISCLSKYGGIIAIILLLITPPILNWALSRPAFCRIVGTDTDWLSFYGGYIGSAISSLVAFFILHQQLKNNHEENENNRQLQISTLQYEQEKQWLHEMRRACVNNVNSYNHNDVREVCNAFVLHPDFEYIFSKIKILIDRINQTDTAIGFAISNDNYNENFIEFDRQRILFYKTYISIIQDIQSTATLINKNALDIEKSIMILDELSFEVKTSIQTKIIEQHLSEVTEVNKCLAIIVNKRAASLDSLYHNVRETSLKYIQQEQQRVNRIFVQNEKETEKMIETIANS